MRIPSLILETLNWIYEDMVDISIENRRIVIIPVKNDTYVYFLIEYLTY